MARYSAFVPPQPLNSRARTRLYLRQERRQRGCLPFSGPVWGVQSGRRTRLHYIRPVLHQDKWRVYMQSRSKRAFVLVPAAMVVSALCFVSIMPAAGMQNSTGYIQHNLVSNLPNTAIMKEPNIKNTWGFAFSPTASFWHSDNGTGVFP